MRVRPRAAVTRLWRNLLASLWFLPGIMALLGIALGLAMVEVDTRIAVNFDERWPRLFGVGAEGARGLLEAVAASMITVAGVAFSITIVALSLASNQYSPRVLRSFIKDRTNQMVLGVFVAIHVYCLIVLRTIQGGEENGFVPSLAVTGGVVLALVGIGFFILFIHHIATSIQVSHILAVAALDTIHAVERAFPEDPHSDNSCGDREGGGDWDAIDAELDRRSWCDVPARQTGYVQVVDEDELLRLAREREVVIRMRCGAGDFVVAGTTLLSVAGGALDDDFEARLNAAYGLGSQRTVEQDPAFGLRQIVDIALRALSPGVHDPSTASEALDQLHRIFVCLCRRPDPARYRGDQGTIRLVVAGNRFDALLTESLEPVRHSAAGNVMVLSRLLRLLTAVGRAAPPYRLEVVRRETLELGETIRRTVTAERELKALTDEVQRSLRTLGLQA